MTVKLTAWTGMNAVVVKFHFEVISVERQLCVFTKL